MCPTMKQIYDADCTMVTFLSFLSTSESTTVSSPDYQPSLLAILIHTSHQHQNIIQCSSRTTQRQPFMPHWTPRWWLPSSLLDELGSFLLRWCQSLGDQWTALLHALAPGRAPAAQWPVVVAHMPRLPCSWVPPETKITHGNPFFSSLASCMRT